LFHFERKLLIGHQHFGIIPLAECLCLYQNFMKCLKPPVEITV
jgi:hypothetical protein